MDQPSDVLAEIGRIVRKARVAKFGEKGDDRGGQVKAAASIKIRYRGSLKSISAASLSRIEQGMAAMDLDTAREVCRAFDISWADEMRYLMRDLWESRLDPDLRFPTMDVEERELLKRFRTDATFRAQTRIRLGLTKPKRNAG